MPVKSNSVVMLAVDRLNVSRLQLQQALMPPRASHSGDGSNHRPFGGWLDRLAKAPATSVVLDTVQRWWARHPMRVGLLLAGDAAQTLIEPAVQKYPYRVVFGAAAAGALLVLSRPWRWLPRAVLTPALTSTLMAGLLPPLINQADSVLSGSAWTRLLAGLTQSPGSSPDRR